MNKIKSIDGLRAVSILMVLLAHGVYTIPAAYSQNPVFTYISNGELGVRFFFVISGYLITKLLIIEKERTGRISIKKFYLRRILRISPIFYLYILTILAIKLFFISDILSNYYLVFFAGSNLWNYQHFFSHPTVSSDKGYWFFGHFWSLAIEEQFYLLWPLLFRNFTKDKLIKICAILILVMPFIRAAHYLLLPGMQLQIKIMLHTGGDTILTGCLGALLEDKIMSTKWTVSLVKNNFFIFILFIILFYISPVLSVMYKGSYGMTIGMTINNILILFIILWSIHMPSLMAKTLNSRLFVRIGILSYSLYIWQQLFLTYQLHYWINQFPQNFIFVFLIGAISYYLFEKPILRFKDNFKTV